MHETASTGFSLLMFVFLFCFTCMHFCLDLSKLPGTGAELQQECMRPSSWVRCKPDWVPGWSASLFHCRNDTALCSASGLEELPLSACIPVAIQHWCLADASKSRQKYTCVEHLPLLLSEFTGTFVFLTHSLINTHTHTCVTHTHTQNTHARTHAHTHNVLTQR